MWLIFIDTAITLSLAIGKHTMHHRLHCSKGNSIFYHVRATNTDSKPRTILDPQSPCYYGGFHQSVPEIICITMTGQPIDQATNQQWKQTTYQSDELSYTFTCSGYNVDSGYFGHLFNKRHIATQADSRIFDQRSPTIFLIRKRQTVRFLISAQRYTIFLPQRQIPKFAFEPRISVCRHPFNRSSLLPNPQQQ